MARTWLGVGLGSLVLLVSAGAQAQCTMDTECKGDRICEEGRCTAPRPAAPVEPAEPATSLAPAPVAAPPALLPAPPPPRPMVLVADPAPPKMVRHSTGMMVGGIVMVAVAPLALLVSATAAVTNSFCTTYDDDIAGGSSYYDDCGNDGLVYGSLLTGAVLLGVGIPLIVVGAKKEPAKASATVAPWATPTAAGFGVRVEL